MDMMNGLRIILTIMIWEDGKAWKDDSRSLWHDLQKHDCVESSLSLEW